MSWRASKLLATLATSCLLAVAFASPALAAGSQGTAVGAIILNPGGGAASDGSDGIRIVLNGISPLASSTGSDQLWFAGTPQWCCGGTGPMLNIGGQLYGEAGAARNTNAISWSSIELVTQAGAVETLIPGASSASSTARGDASVLVRYQAVRAGLTYILDRQISYRSPNNFYVENYTFTIPSGNTDVVKFYQGGDAAPGGSDAGRGFSVSVPNVAAYEVNPNTGIYISYQQVTGGGNFDGLWAAGYSGPYNTISSGGNIGFVTDTNNHDAGLDMQWNLGSTPGVLERSMITQAGFQSVQVSGSFDSPVATVGEPVDFIIQVVNTDFASKTGLSFSGALPVGLSISGSFTTTCTATISAASGSSTFTFDDGSLASASNCALVLPVTGSAGTYNWTDQSFSVTVPLEKGFGSSQLVYSGVPGPGPTPEPQPEIANTGSELNAFAFSIASLLLIAGGSALLRARNRSRA